MLFTVFHPSTGKDNPSTAKLLKKLSSHCFLPYITLRFSYVMYFYFQNDDELALFPMFGIKPSNFVTKLSTLLHFEEKKRTVARTPTQTIETHIFVSL